MNQAVSSMKGGKILLVVIAGVLGLLVMFMSVVYLFQDELQTFVLSEIERQITVAEPAGYTAEQVGEIFVRYADLVDTVQVSDSLSLKIGEAFEAAFDDQVIDSIEAVTILGVIRTLTDPLGPYDSGVLPLIQEPAELAEPDSATVSTE